MKSRFNVKIKYSIIVRPGNKDNSLRESCVSAINLLQFMRNFKDSKRKCCTHKCPIRIIS